MSSLTISSAGSVEMSCVGGCSGSGFTESGSETMLSGEIWTRTQIQVFDDKQYKNVQFNFFSFFDQKVKYFYTKASMKGFKITGEASWPSMK